MGTAVQTSGLPSQQTQSSLQHDPSQSLTLQTARLTAAYEAAQSTLALIQSQDVQRQLRVQLLLLEHDNDDLQSSLLSREIAGASLEDANSDLRSEIAQIDSDLSQTLADLRARERETEQLRAENGALNAAHGDLSKVMGEKLALQRELAVLRPEIEHFRSTGSMQEGLLGEKLALQREVSSLRVELETEKRAVIRLKAIVEKKGTSSEGERDATIDGLHGKIEELKKELFKAQRDAQKNERESRKKLTELENTKEVLEGKLDVFRNKLRTTKEQLKEAQEEIEKMHTVAMAKSAEMTRARIAITTAAAQEAAAATTTRTVLPNPRKRNVARFDPDMTIGTPGHGAQTAKRQRTSVLPGDKSNFSMTPFLNKTMSILPESLLAEEEEAEDEPLFQMQKKILDDRIPNHDGVNEDENEVDAEVENGQSVTSSLAAKASKLASKKPTRGPKGTKAKAQPLKETANPKANVKPHTKAAVASKSAKVVKSTLTQVLEEAENEDPAQDKQDEEDSAEAPAPAPVSKQAPSKPTKTTRPAKAIPQPEPEPVAEVEAEVEVEETMATKLQSILANMPPEKPKQSQKELAKKRTNIFDEDEDNNSNATAVAAAPKLKTLLKPLGVRGGAAGPGLTGGMRLGASSGRTKMLAEFSPLKRH